MNSWMSPDDNEKQQYFSTSQNDVDDMDDEYSIDDEISNSYHYRSMLQECLMRIQSFVSYEGTKAWFRFFLDSAFLEFRVSVSKIVSKLASDFSNKILSSCSMKIWPCC